MTAPATVTLTGDWPGASGYIDVSRPGFTFDGDSYAALDVRTVLGVNGNFTLDVYATDEALISPVNIYYRISEVIDGERRSYAIFVPAAAPDGELDLNTITPSFVSLPALTVQGGDVESLADTSQGEWVTGVLYVKNDWVTYNGSSWLALRNNASITPVQGADWTQLAQVGDAAASLATTVAGAWSIGTTYAANDWVTYNSSSWIALRTNVGVTPVQGADWSLLAEKGVDDNAFLSGPNGVSSAFVIAASNNTETDVTGASTAPNTTEPIILSIRGEGFITTNVGVAAGTRVQVRLRIYESTGNTVVATFTSHQFTVPGVSGVNSTVSSLQSFPTNHDTKAITPAASSTTYKVMMTVRDSAGAAVNATSTLLADNLSQNNGFRIYSKLNTP